MQGGFSTLLGLFDWVGLRKNVGKTYIMVCRPCQEAGTQLEAVYEQRMTSAGLSYREKQRVRMHCSDFGEEMTLGSLAVHQYTQNRKAAGGIRYWGIM